MSNEINFFQSFIPELVQNADDNSYDNSLMSSEADDCPSVKFVMRNDGVVVLNNEKGFQEKDIRALCDVGRSTKGKHKAGYIGELEYNDYYSLCLNKVGSMKFTFQSVSWKILNQEKVV